MDSERFDSSQGFHKGKVAGSIPAWGPKTTGNTMLWILGIIVILVLGLVIREDGKREKKVQEIVATVERIEKLALDNEELSKKVAEKYGKK